MSDTTWGIRTDEDTKKEAIELLNSSGEQGKEFLQSLISAYKIKKAEDLQPLATQELKDLRFHITQIQDIYYNLSKRIDTRLKAKDAELEETLNKKDTEIQDYLIKLSDVEMLLSDSIGKQELNDKLLVQQDKKIQELTESSDLSKQLIGEYKDKNDTLTGLLAEYKGYKDENEGLRESRNNEKELRIVAEREKSETLDHLERIKALHEEDNERLKVKFEDDLHRSIDNLVMEHKQELNEAQRSKDNLSLEHKQALLELQSKHQEEINKLHSDYNNQIQELIKSFSKPMTKTTKAKDLKETIVNK